MYSFLYSIKIGGLVSTRELLFDLIESILLNSSNNNYEIQLHVDDNINVNLKNSHNDTPLHLAVKYGLTYIVRLFR